MQVSGMESEVAQLQASVTQYERLVTEYKAQVCGISQVDVQWPAL